MHSLKMKDLIHHPKSVVEAQVYLFIVVVEIMEMDGRPADGGSKKNGECPAVKSMENRKMDAIAICDAR